MNDDTHYIECAVSDTPAGKPVARIRVQAECFDELGQTKRFFVMANGRTIWDMWFAHRPLFLQNGGTQFQANIQAFPTDPENDHGFLQVIESN